MCLLTLRVTRESDVPQHSLKQIDYHGKNQADFSRSNWSIVVWGISGVVEQVYDEQVQVSLLTCSAV